MESNRFEIFMKGMIKMSLRTSLEIATEEGFNALSKMEVGSEEYVSTAKTLNEMSDRIIAIDKQEAEKEDQKNDKKLRSKQNKHEQIGLHVRNGLTAVSVIGGLVVGVWAMLSSWKYEETGTVTSLVGRKVSNDLLPDFKKFRG